MIRACTLLLGMLATAAGAAAAPIPTTPEDAVRIAMARPEVVAALDADIAEAEAGVIEARSWSNPMLALDREAGDPTRGESDETSLVLSQNFALGPRRRLERQAANLGIDAASAAIAARRAELRAAVLRDYYSALTAGRRHAALAASVGRLERIERIASLRRDAGDLSGFEQRRVSQQAEHARLQRDAAAADHSLAGAELAGRLGIDAQALHLPENIELAPPAPVAPRAAGNRMLDALDARRRQADARLAAARRWQVPLTVGIGQKRFDGAAGRDDALLLELALPLPLLDRNQAERQRAAAEWQRADAAYRIAAHDAETRRTAAEAQLLQRIEQARRLQAELLPQARELARIAEASFAEGELDLPGLLAALDAERETNEQALRAALDARHAAIDFELTYPPPATIGDFK
jgi:outer membrane protein, heavy metal efflux system